MDDILIPVTPSEFQGFSHNRHFTCDFPRDKVCEPIRGCSCRILTGSRSIMWRSASHVYFCDATLVMWQVRRLTTGGLIAGGISDGSGQFDPFQMIHIVSVMKLVLRSNMNILRFEGKCYRRGYCGCGSRYFAHEQQAVYTWPTVFTWSP